MRVLFASVMFLFAFCCACVPKSQLAEPRVPDVGDGWLMFDIQSQEQHGGTTRFRAEYDAEGKMARFDIELKSAVASGHPPIAFSSVNSCRFPVQTHPCFFAI
jgi:hypothetical protein